MNSNTYRLHHNLDSHYFRAWQKGDHLADGHTGTIEFVWSDIEVTLNEIYEIHNSDNRPDGSSAPSLSIGDVIVLGESAFTVAELGFTSINLEAGDLMGVDWRTARDTVAR